MFIYFLNVHLGVLIGYAGCVFMSFHPLTQVKTWKSCLYLHSKFLLYSFLVLALPQGSYSQLSADVKVSVCFKQTSSEKVLSDCVLRQ